jgi:hypothetical protein
MGCTSGKEAAAPPPARQQQANAPPPARQPAPAPMPIFTGLYLPCTRLYPCLLERKKKAKTNHTKTKTVTSDQCELLTLSWSIQGPDLTNVPSEFPPAPVIVAYTAGGSENEYKAYMASKYKYEKWENSLILYKMRENDGNTEACKGILERLNAELYA